MLPGQTLRNGAILIAQKEERDCEIVLAINQNSEYVTWAISENDDTICGHYHQDIFSAVEDFRTRSK